MKDSVDNFIDAKKEILEHFNCPDDYFIKVLKGYNWNITDEDGICFLNYWSKYQPKTTAVVIKKDDEPLIYRSKKYVMVIAIDCVKIGFIFNYTDNIS